MEEVKSMESYGYEDVKELGYRELRGFSGRSAWIIPHKNRVYLKAVNEVSEEECRRNHESLLRVLRSLRQEGPEHIDLIFDLVDTHSADPEATKARLDAGDKILQDFPNLTMWLLGSDKSALWSDILAFNPVPNPRVKGPCSDPALLERLIDAMRGYSRAGTPVKAKDIGLIHQYALQ